ncbi:hypothetical protein [Maribacter thermophilus]|uniref:hypothetical protein n=1 Tax=Maribacter thermophilus TaxID=1197874 RepID=UPI00064140C0|nr:hypothetical protein [Maribacter thermophilus]
MKGEILIVLMLIISHSAISQCELKTTTRYDGSLLNYFNPKPVIRQSNYEIGVSVYKNVTTDVTMLNVSVLFLGKKPNSLNGNAIIQTSGERGISLEPIIFDLVEMNGRDVAVGLYKIEGSMLEYFKKTYLKSIVVRVGTDLVGATVNENEWVIRDNIKCLEK